MKRILIILTVVFSFALIFTACGNKQSSDLAKNETYSCPMHPQISKQHKEQCPICHMDLEKRNMTPAEMQKAQNDLAETDSAH